MIDRGIRVSYISQSATLFLFFCMRIMFTSLISVFLMVKGISALEIGIMSAVSLGITIVLAPAIGHLFDFFGTSMYTGLLLAISSMCSFIFAAADNYLARVISYSIVMLVITSLHPMFEKQATLSKFNYGSLRIWGTVGNAVGTQIAGILYQYVSPAAPFILYGVCTVASIALLPFRQDTNVTNLPTRKETKMNVDSLSGLRKTGTYLFIVFIFYFVLDAKGMYLTPFLVSNGLSVSSSATVLFIASLAEIPIVLFGKTLVDKYGGIIFTRACLLMLLAQMATYALVPNLPAVLIVTLLTNSVVSMLYIIVNLRMIEELVDS